MLQLEEQVMAGDRSALLQLCRKPSFNVARKYSDIGETLLHIACRKGHLDIIRALIEVCRCSLRVTDDHGNSPCHSACEAGQIKVMDYFDKCPYPNYYSTKNSEGNTLLHLACKSGSIPLIRLILSGSSAVYRRPIKLNEYNDTIKESITFQNVHSYNKFGHTPLHIACLNRNFHVIDLFFGEYKNHSRAGFSREIPSLINLAYEMNDYNMVKYFQSKCNNNFTAVIKYNNYGERFGFEKLSSSHASYYEFCSSSSELCSLGDPNLSHSFVELYFFSVARHGDIEAFEKCRNCTTNVSIFSSKTAYGDTLLHAACVSCNIDFVKLIFDFLTTEKIYSCEELRTLKNVFGFTCLHIVCELGSLELAKFFISAGFSIMDVTNLGYTPLHLAILHDRKEVFEHLMCMNNDDINAVTSTMETPLHIATYEASKIEYAKSIVEHKKFDRLNVNKADYCGETPLFNAFRTQSSALVNLLSSEPLNSDMQAVNRKKETVAFIACRLNCTDFIDDIISINEVDLDQSILLAALQCSGARTDPVNVSNHSGMIPHLYKNHKEFFVKHLNKVIDSCPRLTILQQSFMFGNKAVFEFLISLPECDPNSRGENGETVLHLCCKNNNMEYALLCINNSCSVDIQNDDGETPLSVTLIHHHYNLLLTLVELIFEQNGKGFLESCVDSRGNNILHAVGSRCAGVKDIALHIAKIVDHCCKNKRSGNTALHTACDFNNSEIIEGLIKLNYCPESWYNKDHKSPLMMMNNKGDSFGKLFPSIPEKYLHKPYYMCRITDGSHEIDVPLVLHLIKEWFSSSCSSSHCTKTSNSDIIMKLLDSESKYVIDTLGNTIFHYLANCCYHHKCKVFESIVEKAFKQHGSLVTHLNVHKESILHYALSNNSQWFIMKVLERGVPYEFINENSVHKRFMKNALSHGVLHHYLMSKGVHHNSRVRLASSSSTLPSLHILVVGNSGVGKTTLINSLKEHCIGEGESNITSTTGVVRSEICSRMCKYQFSDFAGQPEFDLIKSRYLESRFATLSQYYMHNKFLVVLVVNAEKDLQENQDQIQERASFITDHINDPLLSISAVLVCSHADCIDNKEEKYEEVKKLTEHFQNIGKNLKVSDNVIFMNCKSVADQKNMFPKQTSISDLLKIYDSESVGLTAYTLSPGATELLSFINSKLNKVPFQVKTLLETIKSNQVFKLDDYGRIMQEGDKFVIPEILELLSDPMCELHAHNLIMLLNHSEDESSWLIVSQSVQDMLFSRVSSLFKPQSELTCLSETNNTGIVSSEQLLSIFTEIELGAEFHFDVFLGYLQNMDYCQLLDNSKIGWIMETILAEQYDGKVKYYFFPGLISANKPTDLDDIFSDTKNYPFQFGYLLKANSPLDLRFFQPLMFRLFKFTEVKESSNFSRRIELWKSGIFWVTPDMVKILVEVRNKREVLLICQGQLACDTSKYAASIVNEIRCAKKSICDKLRDMSLGEEYLLLKCDYKREYTNEELAPILKIKPRLQLPIKKRAYYISLRKPERLERFMNIDPYVHLELCVDNPGKGIDEVISHPHSIIKEILDRESQNLKISSSSDLFEILDKHSVFKGSDLFFMYNS